MASIEARRRCLARSLPGRRWQGTCSALRPQGRRAGLAGQGHDRDRHRQLRRAQDRQDDGRAMVRLLAHRICEPAPIHSRPRRSTSHRSRPSSARCRSRWCDRRTSGLGQPGCSTPAMRRRRSTAITTSSRRSWPTRFTTGSFRGRRARGAHRPDPRNSGHTLQPPIRSGHCTTRCLSTYARRSCWARSLVYARPRRAACGWPTLTSCARDCAAGSAVPGY